MYFTDRGIEELESRRGEEEITFEWLAARLQEFVDLNPEFEIPVERLATWLARLDDEDDWDDPTREVEADLFVIATDVDGVYLDWGKPTQRKLAWVTPDELRSYNFPAGSMGPKVQAAIQFVEKTGKRVAIGSLQHIEKIVAGEAGTNVAQSVPAAKQNIKA